MSLRSGALRLLGCFLTLLAVVGVAAPVAAVGYDASAHDVRSVGFLGTAASTTTIGAATYTYDAHTNARGDALLLPPS
jgi:hypothetical protein